MSVMIEPKMPFFDGITVEFVVFIHDDSMWNV